MSLQTVIANRAVTALALALALVVAPIATTSASAGTNSPSDIRVAVLDGEQETTPADADGVAVAVIRINVAQAQVCYLLIAKKLDGTTAAAHIHRAPAGVNGPVVVGLSPPVGGFVRGCATVAPALAAEIAANSSGFYVNIHTSVFPGGAVRGQLRP